MFIGVAAVAAELNPEAEPRPAFILSEFHIATPTGEEYLVYLLHLRIKGAHKNAPQATHEVGLLSSMKPPPVLTLQMSAHSDAHAYATFYALIDAICDGEVPLKEENSNNIMANAWSSGVTLFLKRFVC